jgi:hypothetical protein
MVLKEFHINIPGKGKVDVSFYLHFDAHSASVGEIKLHADYDSGLPHRAKLKQDLGKWKLYDDHPVMVNGELKVVPEFLDTEVSNTVVNRILEIKADESFG